MSSWTWDMEAEEDGCDFEVSHDGKVTVTISTPYSESSVTLVSLDFEEMCQRFILRMGEWRLKNQREAEIVQPAPSSMADLGGGPA